MGELPAELERVLLSADEIAALVDKLAARLNADYAGRTLVTVGALTGAAVFCADLVRRLTMPVQMDFVCVSSYGTGTTSAGCVTWRKEPSLDLAGCDVLLVDDIVDSGRSLVAMREALLARRPASLATSALLSKPDRRQVAVEPEYLGCDIPDEFVVGYGLDWAQRFRNLPYIGVVRREAYS